MAWALYVRALKWNSSVGSGVRVKLKDGLVGAVVEVSKNDIPYTPFQPQDPGDF